MVESKRKLRVGVLFGGRSGEHEVSLLSAASVMQALDRKKFDIVPIGITKEGRWVAAQDAERLLAGSYANDSELRAGDFALLERVWRRQPVHANAFGERDIAEYKQALGRP